jgi:NADPH2:quinone reductase
MRALQADHLDSIDGYREVELPLPEPGPAQARIRVDACGVGYVDALVSLGRYQVKPALPHIPGGEVGGTIDALGPDVSGLAVGDRVMAAAARGGFAEFTLAPAEAVWKIPDAMSFEQASGFRVNYLTALHGLRDRAAVRPGERLLVTGAAGGVGLAAVQVGRILGAEPIAACSTDEKRAFAYAQGATASIDTEPEGWRERLRAVTGGAGIDVVFDPVCGPLFELGFRSLAWRGRHLVIGFAGGPIPALKSNLPLMKGAALVGVDVRQFPIFEPEAAGAYLTELLGWVGEGRLVPPVGRVFGFDEAKAALEFALTGSGVGKTVLKVA